MSECGRRFGARPATIGRRAGGRRRSSGVSRYEEYQEDVRREQAEKQAAADAKEKRRKERAASGLEDEEEEEEVCFPPDGVPSVPCDGLLRALWRPTLSLSGPEPPCARPACSAALPCR